ncbi:Cullin-4B [Candida viswanathii]|uniref:Cullin-4B n=1 Tax=Candida viswanathii TaxID=5486 RepID=A0A367XTY4_9ASCO|nr:Cullin-4B [Candida viswanathii]
MSNTKNNWVSSMLDLNNVSSNTLSTATSANSNMPVPPERSVSHLTSTTPSPRLYHRTTEDSLEPQDSKRKKLNTPNTAAAQSVDAMEEIEKLNALALSTVDAILLDLPMDHSVGFLAHQFLKLCKSKHLLQNFLMHQIHSKIDNDLVANIKPQIEEALGGAANALEFTEKFFDVFDTWYARMVKLSKVFVYLDTNYLAVHTTRPQLLPFAISLFKDHVILGTTELSRGLIEQYYVLLRTWRRDVVLDVNAPEPNQHLYEMAIKFTKLLYESRSTRFEFVENLIELTVNYYSELRLTWMRDNKGPFSYIQQVFKAMNENLKFFSVAIKNDYFLKRLFSKLRWNLIFIKFNDILHNVFEFLVDHPKELLLIYRYCELAEDEYGLNGMATLSHQWGKFTKRRFDEIITSNGEAKTGWLVINELVKSFKYFEKLTEKQFLNNNIEFKLRYALTQAVNGSASRKSFIISQLAKYCDAYFRQKLNVPYEDFAENFLIILKSIGDLLEFVDVYKRDLSKRMLFSSRFNREDESDLAGRLRDHLGPTDESHSLTVIFADFEKKYASLAMVPRHEEILADSFKFEPLILTKKEWPDIPKNEDMSNFKLNLVLQRMLDSMSTQYQKISSKHKLRQLDWTNYKLHQVTVSTTFKQGEKEVTGNLLQIQVIMLFGEDNDGYTVDQLATLTGLNRSFLIKVLNSITTEKYKILVVKDGKYHFNEGFTDKSKSIKLPMIRESAARADQQQQQQQEEEQRQLENTIQANRDDEFKSCVVKIMKQEQRLDIYELLNKSIAVLEKKQPVDFAKLKVVIEKLIETEYLERDDADKNILIYIP